MRAEATWLRAVRGIMKEGFSMGDDHVLAEIRKRAAERRRRMVVHRAEGFEDAEAWDLEYWQSKTPEQRLEAYMALREDVKLVIEAKGGRSHSGSGAGGDG